MKTIVLTGAGQPPGTAELSTPLPPRIREDGGRSYIWYT